MKQIKRIFIALVAVVLISSCDLNKLDNPNLLAANQADPGLMLNGVQINFADFFVGLSDAGMQVTRLIHFYGPIYNNWFIPSYFNNQWSAAYNGVLVNTNAVITQAGAKKWYYHTAIAKVIQAYVAMTMTDYFGDIPYSHALNPNDFNPSADKGADVYAAALAMLDDAAADLDKATSATPIPSDLYYGNNWDNWRALINTLKFKAAVNTGSVSVINSLLGANLIDAADGSEDFQFRYSSNISNPDSRNPYFSGWDGIVSSNYVTGAGNFHTNWLMSQMRYGKTNADGSYAIDPRIRYYFYRQSGYIDVSDPNLINLLSCIKFQKPARYTKPEWGFCFVKDPKTGGNEGYWGRDYGDASGVNPDTKERTNWGVYPIGGKFDDDSFVPNTPNDGLKGAGIAPIMLASYVDFMKAEAAQRLGTAGNPQALLISAVDKSINKVMSFGASTATSHIPTEIDINNYEAAVKINYANAGTSGAQMDVIAKEYWIAGFGNGIEIYNMYRRTNGRPSDMQPALRDPGQFPNTFPYPLVYTAQNSQAESKDFSAPVFWYKNSGTSYIN